MNQNPIIAAVTTLANLPTDSRELLWFTREFNLYLDVVRLQGQRDQFSAVDLHVLLARWQDLAQIAPLPPTDTQKAVAGAVSDQTEFVPVSEHIDVADIPRFLQNGPRDENA